MNQKDFKDLSVFKKIKRNLRFKFYLKIPSNFLKLQKISGDLKEI